MIEFKNISKKYGSTEVLENINFSIDEGELICLIGESGCGKTTLLKMINRLIPSTSGTIMINGEDIKKKDVIKLRRNIGYVIQQTGLFPHMTIKENIELIEKIEKIPENEINEKTIKLMNMVGLDPEEYLDKYPTELSGGQQQRIGVARAFALDPKIILMDEPFSALDPITRSDLQDELIDLQNTHKKTIVFVTHDMDEAIKIADKICIMANGDILQFDTPEEIMKNPINDEVANFVGTKRIWDSPELIKLEDIMIEKPHICTSDMSLLMAMRQMQVNRINSALVVDRHSRKLEGIVQSKRLSSVRDKSLKVSEYMKKELKALKTDDNILDALNLLNSTDLSSIPVVDDNNVLKGLITYSNMVMTLSEQYMEDE